MELEYYTHKASGVVFKGTNHGTYIKVTPKAAGFRSTFPLSQMELGGTEEDYQKTLVKTDW